MAADADISDADLSELCTTNFNTSLGIEVDHMNRLGGRLGHWLNDHVVFGSLVNDVVEEVEFTTVCT